MLGWASSGYKYLSMYQPESPKVEVVGGKISRDALTDLTDCRCRTPAGSILVNVVEVGQIRTRRAEQAQPAQPARSAIKQAAMRLQELIQAFTTSQKDTCLSISLARAPRA